MNIHGHCPKCDADWDGGEIPEDIRKNYRPPYRWSRCVGIYDMRRDITVAYKCLDCGEEFPR